MARIEGTGIAAPSKKSMRLAGNLGPSTPVRIDTGVDIRTGKPYKRVFQDFGAGRVGEIRLKKAEADTTRPSFFSPGGGAFDERNDIKVAQAGSNFTNLVTDNVNQKAQPLSPIGSEAYKKELEGFKEGFKKDFNYRTRYDLDTGEEIDKYFRKVPGGAVYGEKEMERDYPIFRQFKYERNPLQYQQGVPFGKKEEEKPSLLERTAKFAGGLFDTITGTQPASATQVVKPVPTSDTPFSSTNLDAARSPVGSVTTGDTSFASYRMGGEQQQQQGSGIVTPFSQTSMGKGEDRKVTPFSETSMGKGEDKKVTPFSETSMANKTVTVDGQKVAARQTVASLPSDYKATEAEAFRKAAAFQEAKKIAERNPNVSVGVDNKGQPVARAVQKTRDEAGPSARTAAGNQARVKQNAQARAQAAAVNRKLSGKSISQTKADNKAKMRASAAARNASFQARKKAGTLSRSERTASGQRAAKRSAARKRAQAAAKRRRAKKKGKKRCDIFLKYNISPLTNMNLIRDDLAEVAYFVKEIQEK